MHAVLREARRSAGLTQRELAARAGTSQATIARYESGAVSPTLRTFQRLIEACGLRVTLQLHREDEQLDRQIREQLARDPAERVAFGLTAARAQAPIRHAARRRRAG